MRGWRRMCSLVAIPGILAVLGIAGVGVGVAQAASGACAPGVGVTVIVDFGGLGPGIERGCAITPGDGLSALNSAGFTTDFVPRFSNQFVCRIKGQPSDQTCVNTPPASAYWSYWHADADQSTWTYSGQGATSRNPPPGSVDAWRFGATDLGGGYGQPSISPAQARGDRPQPEAPTSTPAATSASASAPPAATVAATTTQAPTSSSVGTTAVPTSASPSPSPSASPAPSASQSASASASGPTTSSSTPPANGPRVVDIQPASARTTTDGGGSALPTILGVALAAAVAGAGGFVAWRRRQQTE